MGDSDPGGDRQFYAGYHYFLAGNYPAAIAAFTAAASANPENRAAFHNRALARAALADSDGALEDAFRAIEMNPTSAPTMALAAALHHARGSESRARRVRLGSPSMDSPSETVRSELSLEPASVGHTAPALVDDLPKLDRVLVRGVPDRATLQTLLIENPEN